MNKQYGHEGGKHTHNTEGQSLRITFSMGGWSLRGAFNSEGQSLRGVFYPVGQSLWGAFNWAGQSLRGAFYPAEQSLRLTSPFSYSQKKIAL